MYYKHYFSSGIGREMQRIFKLEVMDNGRFYVTDMSETTW
jgi:hypothetical protein